MEFKQKVYNSFLQLINEKIILFNSMLNDLRESSKGETKSSAGDKYETARAMLQIEQDNVNRQLKETNAQKDILTRIDITINPIHVISGSLLKTNKGYLFVTAALGKILVEGIPVIALSPQSPLGIKLLGAVINDVIEINGTSYSIENIT